MDLSSYKELKPHRKRRVLWVFVNATIFRYAYGRLGWPIRRLLLELFGATIDKNAYIYGSCKIFAPWNLVVGRACIGPRTQLYNKDIVHIGNDSVVSQGSFLCSASHDTHDLMLPLKIGPITIRNNVWVAADVFIGPNVTIEDGAVIGARSAVFYNVNAWTIVRGNPAQFIKRRVVTNRHVSV